MVHISNEVVPIFFKLQQNLAFVNHIFSAPQHLKLPHNFEFWQRDQMEGSNEAR